MHTHFKLMIVQHPVCGIDITLFSVFQFHLLKYGTGFLIFYSFVNGIRFMGFLSKVLVLMCLVRLSKEKP